LLLCACTAAFRPQADPYVDSLREEYRAILRAQSVLVWYSAVEGPRELLVARRDALFSKSAFGAIDRAQARSPADALALKFLRRSLTARIVALSVAKLDDEYDAAEADATVTLPWCGAPVSYRDVASLIAQEPDAARRQEAYAAQTRIIESNLRAADLPRLWKAPQLARYFDKSLELKALAIFLKGIGLDLRTAAGTEVRIDDSLRPRKRPRAFVQAVDAPADVRMSVKPVGGLDDYRTLFHEAGHAVHFASATIEPKELVTLAHGTPSEAFGEFFRALSPTCTGWFDTAPSSWGRESPSPPTPSWPPSCAAPRSSRCSTCGATPSPRSPTSCASTADPQARSLPRCAC
jgi:hypothetical protein